MSTVIVTNSTQALAINNYDGGGNISETFPIPVGAQATQVPSWVPSSADFESFTSDEIASAITVANSVTLITGATTANVELFTSGSPTTVSVSNPGDYGVWIAIGSSSVAATVGSGTFVGPGAAVSLSLASATYLAAIAVVGSTVLVLNVGS